MSCQVNSTNGPKKYVTLTITDNQNGNKKNYKVEAGSILELTNSKYEITENCTIDVTLPQYQALQVFDHNRDGRLDTTDQEFFINRHEKYLNSLPPEAFDGLYLEDEVLAHDISSRLGNSQYHIKVDGGGHHLEVNEAGFWVCFENQVWFERDENYDEKFLGFQTSTQAEYNRNSRAKAEAEAKKEKTRLDDEFAKEHPFLSKLGISREKYESFMAK